jgi:hypothetical protein
MSIYREKALAEASVAGVMQECGNIIGDASPLHKFADETALTPSLRARRRPIDFWFPMPSLTELKQSFSQQMY